MCIGEFRLYNFPMSSQNITLHPSSHEGKRLRDLKKGNRDRNKPRSKSIERSASTNQLNGSLSGSKSNLSGFFSRNFSMKKDKEGGSKKSGSGNRNYDLSMDISNPGVLKVFCGGLQEGTDYKSVLFTSRSTAGQVLVEVLERLGVTTNKTNLRDYVLCEVAGHIIPLKQTDMDSNNKDSGIFAEDYHRTLQPDEIVSKIQTFWVPANGLRRRFEIRGRPDSDKEDVGYNSDNETRGVNASARQYIRAKTLGHKSMSVMDLSMTHENSPKLTEMSSKALQTDLSISGAITDRRTRTTRHVPLGPYLLLLKGYDQRNDLLLHELYDTNVIGKSPRCDIQLFSDDIPEEVCRLQTEHNQDTDASKSRLTYTMFIEPCLGGVNSIMLNGILVREKTALSPGDFVNVDGKYVFLYKDTSHVPDRLLTLSTSATGPTNATSILSHESRRKMSDTTSLSGGSSSGGTSKRSDPFQRPSCLPSNYSNGVDSGVPHLHSLGITHQYSMRDTASDVTSFVEEHVMASQEYSRESDGFSEGRANCLTEMATQVLREFSGPEAMSPEVATTFLLLLVEYSRCELSDSEGRPAVEVTEDIQWQISEAVSNTAQRASHPSSNKSGETNGMPSNWMGLFHFALVSQRMLDYFRADNSGDLGHWVTFMESMTEQISEDLIRVLIEDVLPMVDAVYLDNPFTSHKGGGPGIQNLLCYLDRLEEAMTRQFIDSPHAERLTKGVFYRLAVLMAERVVSNIVCDSTMFNWNRGVQMRGNLDQLEDWFRNRFLPDTSNALGVLCNTIDLLATPKTKLLQTSWPEFRNCFPHLPISVLNCILENYDQGKGPTTDIWSPDASEQIEADYDPLCALQDLTESEIKEHPLITAHPAAINISQKVIEADFTAYQLQMDLDLHDLSQKQKEKHFPLRWRDMIDQVLASPTYTAHHYARFVPKRSASGSTSGRPAGRFSSSASSSPLVGIGASTSGRRASQPRLFPTTSRPLPSGMPPHQHHYRKGPASLTGMPTYTHQQQSGLEPYQQGYPHGHTGGKASSMRGGPTELTGMSEMGEEKPDSAYSSSGTTSKSQRRQEIEHLKQITRSLQNICSQNNLNFGAISAETRPPLQSEVTHELPKSATANYTRRPSGSHFPFSPSMGHLSSSPSNPSSPRPIISHTPSEGESNTTLINAAAGIVPPYRQRRARTGQNAILSSAQHTGSNSYAAASPMTSRLTHQQKPITSNSKELSGGMAAVLLSPHLSGGPASAMAGVRPDPTSYRSSSSSVRTTSVNKGDKKRPAPAIPQSPNVSIQQRRHFDNASLTNGRPSASVQLTKPDSTNQYEEEQFDRDSISEFDLRSTSDTEEEEDMDPDTLEQNETSRYVFLSSNGGRDQASHADDEETSDIDALSLKPSPSLKQGHRQSPGVTKVEEVVSLEKKMGANAEDILSVILVKDEKGSLGLGIVDGETTALDQTGIYIRSFRPGGPAEVDGRLRQGDRILGVNDESVVGKTYDYAMSLLRGSQKQVKILAAKSDFNTTMNIMSPKNED